MEQRNTFPTKTGYHHFKMFPLFSASFYPFCVSQKTRQSTAWVVSGRKHTQISHHRKTQWGVASLEKERDLGIHSTGVSLVAG